MKEEIKTIAWGKNINTEKIKRHCPSCKSSRIKGDLNNFYCEKCGYAHKKEIPI